VPYDTWHAKGFLETTPGSSVSYEYVAHHLKHVFDQHRVAKIAFDRWNMQHLKPWLLTAGFTERMIEDKFVGFGQGFKSMSPALRDLESSSSKRSCVTAIIRSCRCARPMPSSTATPPETESFQRNARPGGSTA
jgi:phage terminase large subunit-like protein